MEVAIRPLFLASIVLVLGACRTGTMEGSENDLIDTPGDDTEPVVDEDSEPVDEDGDGYNAPGEERAQNDDCDDRNEDVHPGALEKENAKDDDCDGIIDEGTAAYDDDRDGWTEANGDCDDTSSGVYPGNGCGDDPEPEPVDTCGVDSGLNFRVNSFQVLFDPVDFDGDTWDWDGGGISDFWDQYGDFIDLLLEYGTEGEYEAGTLDDYMPAADAGAGLVTSGYVAPDITLTIDYFDGSELGFVQTLDFDEDNAQVGMSGEADFDGEDDAYVFTAEDRDWDWNDEMKGFAWTPDIFRAFANCGPVTYVFSDAEMDDSESRIRAIALDISEK